MKNNNKLIYIIVFLVFGICLASIYFSLQNISSKMDGNSNDVADKQNGDNNSNDIDNGDNSNVLPSDDDVKEINNFVEYIKSYEVNNRVDYDNLYNIYYLSFGSLRGYNYNTTNSEFVNNLNYNFGADKEKYNGKFFIKNDGSIYYTINNGEKCYVKPFESENIEVYSLSETEKCYKAYVTNEQLTVDLFAHDSVTGVLYNDGEISDSSLRVAITTNLLDIDAATYKWYRNGILVENNSSSSLLIETDEDAEYYVEMISFDGKTAKSPSLTIKIKK